MTEAGLLLKASLGTRESHVFAWHQEDESAVGCNEEQRVQRSCAWSRLSISASVFASANSATAVSGTCLKLPAFTVPMGCADTEERDEGIARAAEGRLDDIIDVQLDAQRSRMPGQSSRERAEVLAARAGRFRREGRVPVRVPFCCSHSNGRPLRGLHSLNSAWEPLPDARSLLPVDARSGAVGLSARASQI